MKPKVQVPVFVAAVLLLAMTLMLLGGASAKAAEPAEFLIPLPYGSFDAAEPMNVDNLWMDLDPENPYGLGRLPSASAGDAIYPFALWTGISRGLVQTIGNATLLSLEMWRQPGGAHGGSPDFAITPREAKDLWGRPFYFEELTAFNPHIGAGSYTSSWFTGYDASLLGAGDYTIRFTLAFKHTTIDLWGGYFEGQHAPVRMLTGEPLEFWLWFTITE